MLDESLRARLQTVHALLEASRNPQALVDLIVSASTRAGAERAVADMFRCSLSAAANVIDSRFSSLLGEEVARLALEADELEARLGL